MRDIDAALRGWDVAFSPAMHVLAQERVPSEARPYIQHLLSGQELLWDQAPLAEEPWRVYAGVSSGAAQVARLFGKEVGFDQWGDKRRLTFTSLSWDPLPYSFGWWVACRPFAGVTFSRDPAEGISPLQGVRYLDSWPHGYLLYDEARRFLPMIRELIIALALRLQARDEEEPGELTREQLESGLHQRGELEPDLFVELHALGQDRDLEGWQLRRALHLLEAATKAVVRRRDLLCLGY